MFRILKSTFCITIAIAAFTSQVGATQLEDRSLKLRSLSSDKPTSGVRVTGLKARGAKLAGTRCAQLEKRLEKIAERKSAVLGSETWSNSQREQIMRNFGQAEKDMANKIDRCHHTAKSKEVTASVSRTKISRP